MSNSGTSTGLPTLENFFVHRQEPGTQPQPWQISAGWVRVELMLEGQGWFLGDGLSRLVVPGEMAWHNHGGWTIGRTGPEGYTCLAVNLSLRRQAEDGSEVIRWESIESIRSFVDHVTTWSSAGFVPEDALAAWIVGRLVCERAAGRERVAHSRLDERMRRAREILTEEWSEPLSMDEVASRVGWGRAQFFARFRAEVGVSPYRFLMTLRLREARRRILETDTPIKQIAVDCGFAHAAALGAAFRAAEGTSPGRLRRRWRRGRSG